MAIATLTKRQGVNIGYYYEETIADGTNGDTIKIPPLQEGASVTCTIESSGNTGKVQFTTSSDADVTAGTETWQDWPSGNVTATTTDRIVSPVTGVRGVSVSGEVVFQVIV